MPQLTHVNFSGSWYSHSFTTGAIKSTPKQVTTERDILARAMWLERHGRTDEALVLIDQLCGGKRGSEADP